jgi:hypothetical protein
VSRLPNLDTLAAVRAETLDWYWREFSFLLPRPDPEIVAYLDTVCGPDMEMSASSVLEIQGWAAYMAGQGITPHEEPDTTDLLLLDAGVTS